jgi:hypothetical protein
LCGAYEKRWAAGDYGNPVSRDGGWMVAEGLLSKRMSDFVGKTAAKPAVGWLCTAQTEDAASSG